MRCLLLASAVLLAGTSSAQTATKTQTASCRSCELNAQCLNWVGSTHYGGTNDHCAFRMDHHWSDENQLICPTWETRCDFLSKEQASYGQCMRWVGSKHYGGTDNDHCAYRLDGNGLVCPTWEQRCCELTRGTWQGGACTENPAAIDSPSFATTTTAAPLPTTIAGPSDVWMKSSWGLTTNCTNSTEPPSDLSFQCGACYKPFGMGWVFVKDCDPEAGTLTWGSSCDPDTCANCNSTAVLQRDKCNLYDANFVFIAISGGTAAGGVLMSFETSDGTPIFTNATTNTTAAGTNVTTSIAAVTTSAGAPTNAEAPTNTTGSQSSAQTSSTLTSSLQLGDLPSGASGAAAAGLALSALVVVFALIHL